MPKDTWKKSRQRAKYGPGKSSGGVKVKAAKPRPQKKKQKELDQEHKAWTRKGVLKMLSLYFFEFGKYSGRSFAYVARTEPSYLTWVAKKDFNSGAAAGASFILRSIVQDAADQARKSRRGRKGRNQGSRHGGDNKQSPEAK